MLMFLWLEKETKCKSSAYEASAAAAAYNNDNIDAALLLMACSRER